MSADDGHGVGLVVGGAVVVGDGEGHLVAAAGGIGVAGVHARAGAAVAEVPGVARDACRRCR